ARRSLRFGEHADMTNAIALLLVLLASVSEARADDRVGGSARRLRLAVPELFATFASSASMLQPGVMVAAGVLNQRGEPTAGGALDQHDEATSGFPPFFTLVAPRPLARGESGDTETKPPLFALGARVQGRTLVAFTRPGTKT